MLNRYSIRHPTAGRRLFAERPMKEGNVVGYYWAVLVYESSTDKNRSTKKYGEHIIVYTNESFKKRANDVLDSARDKA